MKLYLEGQDIYLGIKKAAEELIKNKDEINALNVFPVPDGDTGSNMSSAMLEACEWLNKVKDTDNTKEVLKALRDGLLMGARGNSGVILSQIFRGFTEHLENIKKIQTSDFINAIKTAKDVSYNAVMKPVEGTMLTLMRRLYERADVELREEKDFLDFTDKLIKISFELVDETPKYLKKLREANVVDAGALGVAYIFKGIRDAIHGDTEVDLEKIKSASTKEIATIAFEDLTFQYCTECVLKLSANDISKPELDSLRAFLDEMGDSIVLVHQNEFLKCHVHTNHPGHVFEKFLEYGDLMKIKVDNMKMQHEHVVESGVSKPQIQSDSYPERNWGIITVSPGKGLTEIFKSLGVNEVISGGQTMNPSVRDFSAAIDKMPYKNIIILPNNPNIIMTAEKSKEMTDKNILVIPTKYVQEGISALLAYDDNLDYETVETAMNDIIKSIIPIQATYAVRDSEIGEEKIKKGEYLIFAGKDLKEHGKNLYKKTEMVLNQFLDEGFEIVTIFHGEGANLKDIEKMVNRIVSKHSDVEIEIHEGGQKHYPMLISLE